MQCCVSVLCDATLMYLAAPTPVARRGLLQARFPGLPAHAFQAAAPGQAGCVTSTRTLHVCRMLEAN